MPFGSKTLTSIVEAEMLKRLNPIASAGAVSLRVSVPPKRLTKTATTFGMWKKPGPVIAMPFVPSVPSYEIPGSREPPQLLSWSGESQTDMFPFPGFKLAKLSTGKPGAN